MRNGARRLLEKAKASASVANAVGPAAKLAPRMSKSVVVVA
jgi:hypothetical protein